ncbi:serine/threonine protein kinase [bacterium]|nr:serine/threonine protein kinase [bacterium]
MPEPAGGAPRPPEEDTRAPGSQIGRFELIEQIGHGSMGDVFTARHAASGRTIVLKLLPRELASDEAFAGRFVRKTQAVVELHHNNIVQCIDVGQDKGECFFAMEYVDGVTLRELLDREGRVEEARALRMTLDLARALAHAHKYGIRHGRIKPENVMVTSDGGVKLAELGLARAALTLGSTDATGAVTPRPEYLAPEQAQNKPDIDVRADIYSLGAVLFEMVTGDPPHRYTTAARVLARVARGRVHDPRRRNPMLSDDVCDLIETLMARRRRERPKTPTAVVKAVEKILEKEVFRLTRGASDDDDIVVVGELQVPPFVPPRKSRRMEKTFALAVAAIVILVLIGRGCV